MTGCGIKFDIFFFDILIQLQERGEMQIIEVTYVGVQLERTYRVEKRKS